MSRNELNWGGNQRKTFRKFSLLMTQGTVWQGMMRITRQVRAYCLKDEVERGRN